MTGRFTDHLRAISQPTWENAVNHRFITALYAGEVPDAAMKNYLIQDYRFLDSFLVLIGAAITQADTLEARLRFGRFAGMISSDEDTYFQRAFAALGINEAEAAKIPDTAPTAGFKAIMREAAATGSYPVILSVLNVAEWLYYEWASAAPQPLPENFIYAEWVTLHDNPDFNAFVAFIRSELDRTGPNAPDICEAFFKRAVVLEEQFFDAAYA